MKILSLLFLCLVSSLSAQWTPALFIEGEKETRDQLRVDQLDVQVVIVGNVAETSMTMRFRNDTNRVLEGEFVCPLNEGQDVAGYALEIGDEMRAGVAVEKQQARQVFEDIVRQNIDPGLAEWTKGNNFRTRVYPIPAKGTKRVGVTFREVLPIEGDHLRYRLPLEFENPLARFSISISAPHALGDVAEITDPSSGLTLKQTAKRGWKLSSIRKNYSAKGPLEVRLPIKRGPMVSVGRGPGEKRYFHVTDRVLIPVGEGPAPAPVKSIYLVWDASGSGELRDHEKERALLREMLTHYEGASVRLSLLRHEVEPLGRFSDSEALLKKLEQVSYDGGTDPSRLDLSEIKEDLIILVSDGISTLGHAKFTPGEVPIHIFHAAPSAEYDRLQGLAQATAGRYVNLSDLSVEAALSKLIKPTFKLLSVEGGMGTIPGGPIEVPPSGFVDLSGELDGDAPMTLTLNYGFSGKVITSQEVTIDPQKDLIEGRQVASLWAGHQLRFLLRDREANREKMTALGREFGLVTPYTSLLVLDRIEDYVEHRIIPPTAELRKEYERLVKPQGSEIKVDDSHFHELLTRWKELEMWHKLDFDPIDIQLFHRLVVDREKVKGLLKRRFFSKAPKLTKVERKELAATDEKLAVLQNDLAQFGSIPPQQRRKVISNYASRYAKIRKLLYGGKQSVRGDVPTSPTGEGSVGNIVTAGNRSGAAAVSRNSIDGILNRPPPASGGSSEDSFGGGGILPSAPMAAPSMGGDDRSPESTKITLAKWDPKTPYLNALKKASKDRQEAVYLEWREKNLKSSAFYLDVSQFFLDQQRRDLALRVLTNVGELDLESIPLMRILAHRLNQMGEHERALALFEEVSELRPDEPQSKRDLALTLGALKRYQEAGDLLWELIEQPEDDRFEGIHLVALIELNALVSRHGIQTSAYDPRFLTKIDCDARIILTWDSNDSDMDLWVTDPLGELCNYSKDRTEAGGRMSDDFTEGYGPEEFLVKQALHGKYQVEVDFFGTRQQIIAGATTIQVDIFTNWGRKNQKSQKVTLRLKGESELVFVGEFELR